MTNEKYCFYARFYSEKTKTEQMNTMRKFIKDNNIAIKDTFYFEDYAKNSLDKREGLQQVLRLAYEGEYKQLIILIPQILHIDYYEFEKMQGDLASYGVEIIKLAGEDAVIDVQG